MNARRVLLSVMVLGVLSLFVLAFIPAQASAVESTTFPNPVKRTVPGALKKAPSIKSVPANLPTVMPPKGAVMPRRAIPAPPSPFKGTLPGALPGPPKGAKIDPGGLLMPKADPAIGKTGKGQGLGQVSGAVEPVITRTPKPPELGQAGPGAEVGTPVNPDVAPQGQGPTGAPGPPRPFGPEVSFPKVEIH
jgi:hypothetical protein